MRQLVCYSPKTGENDSSVKQVSIGEVLGSQFEEQFQQKKSARIFGHFSKKKHKTQKIPTKFLIFSKYRRLGRTRLTHF